MNPLIQLKINSTTSHRARASLLRFYPERKRLSRRPTEAIRLNTAEGQKALFSLTTGSGNTAVGWDSLF